MDVGSGQPSGLEERGDQQHAVHVAGPQSPGGPPPAPPTSAITWPRSVESLRLISSIGAPRRLATAIRPRAARVVSSAAAGSPRLREFVSTKHVRGRTAERGLVGVLLQDGHDLDAVHRLRAGRVIVQDTEHAAVRRSHRADRRPKRLVVRAGLGQPGEHLGRGRQAVAHQSDPFRSPAAGGRST